MSKIPWQQLLKKELSLVLSHHALDIQNIRGQGYDGLQALFLNECPYAYYIHYMAHRLQLALVAAFREVIPVHQFFSKLTFVLVPLAKEIVNYNVLKQMQLHI